MTATGTATYRKTKSGQWVAFGPANLIKAHTQIPVTKRDGTVKREAIASVGRPFTVHGQQMVYGYLTPAAPKAKTSSHSREMCAECNERTGVVDAVDLSGISGKVCRRCKAYEGELSFA